MNQEKFDLHFNNSFLEFLPDSNKDLSYLKGHFSETELVFEGKRFSLNFFTPVRLMQEIYTDINNEGYFFKENIIIVEKITFDHLVFVVSKFVRSPEVKNLAPKIED